MLHHPTTTEPPAWDGAQDHDRSQTVRDLDRLLNLAEWLADKCEKHKTRQTWLFHYGTGLGGAVLTAAGLVWAFMDPESQLRGALTGAILGTASGVASVSVAYWLTLRRRKNADQKALDEVVALLRVASADIDGREDLSQAERATYRIRLNRLGIRPGAGPEKHGLLRSVANWLWHGGR